MRRRVVITGMGVVTPLGHRPDALFAGLAAGRSGVGPITRFDARTFHTTFAAEVRDFDLAAHVPDAGRWADSGEAARFAAAAARQALAAAGLLDAPGVDRDRFGVYLGTGEGSQQFDALLGSTAAGYDPTGRRMDPARFAAHARTAYHPRREYEQELHVPAGHLADSFDLRGPVFGNLTACAAGAQAVGEAADLIRAGEADLMLAGGGHSSVHPLVVGGFNLLTALSRRNDAPEKASRPFDRDRDGFVIGEGAGVVMLEELEHARKRGASILAELTGYGVTADAYRVTDSHPDGRGAAACMRRALADAGVAVEQVGYVNAHGTGTKVNDLAETRAIRAVFGPAADRVPVSSTKSMIGHLIGAAGAVELVICVEAVRRGLLPPTINYDAPDPGCDLDYVPNVAREKRVDHALSNSFGFGGQNVALVVSRFAG